MPVQNMRTEDKDKEPGLIFLIRLADPLNMVDFKIIKPSD